VSVINARTDKVTATIPVGVNPFGVAVSPLTGNVYVSNSGDNTVQVLPGF
jgi:DNA-binding beta-propeller fold protein YncE